VKLQAPSQEEHVGDANGSGIADIVDIQASAADPDCQVYLPLVVAQWRQPWPTPPAANE